jgi:hypothetical protein
MASWYFAIKFAEPATFHLPYGLINDLYIPWNASRAILAGSDPYDDSITEQNQRAAFGGTALSLHERDERRFAYPLYAAFPYLPFGLMSFEAANRIVFFALAALAVLSVGWLGGSWNRDTLMYCVLFFASYPLILALQVRQPTLLFLALGIAGFHLLRRGDPLLAGLVAALSTGKPQVALPIVLPMLIWSFARWRECKGFVASFIGGCAALIVTSSILAPHWLPEWIAALRSYTQYCGPSFVSHYLGDHVGLIVSALSAAALTLVLWMARNSDLLFLTSLSVVVCQFLLPVFMYSEVILLIPAVWIANNASNLQSQGELSQLALAGVRVAFVAFWGATAFGAAMLHFDGAGKEVAWQIGQKGLTILPLLITLSMATILHAGPAIKHPEGRR